MENNTTPPGDYFSRRSAARADFCAEARRALELAKAAKCAIVNLSRHDGVRGGESRSCAEDVFELSEIVQHLDYVVCSSRH